MADSRILLTTLLVFSQSILFAQSKINSELSKQIDNLNHRAFDLTNSDPFQARLLNAKAFRLLKKGKVDPIVKSDVYSVAGNIESQSANYDKALEYFLICLNIRDNTDSIQKLADIMYNIGNVHYYLKNYKKAVDYYHLSLNTRHAIKENELNLVSVYNSLSQVYESEKMNYPDSALYYYKRSLNIVNKFPTAELQRQNVSDLYSNLGQYYRMQSQYENALFYFNKAQEIQKLRDDLLGVSWTYHHIGIVYDEQHNSPLAKAYFHKAENLAVLLEDFGTQRDVSESWIRLYTSEKNSDSVAYYHEQIMFLNEKINERDIKSNAIEIETKYKIQAQEERIQKIEARQRQNLSWGITGIIILILGFFFLIRNYRQKQRISRMQLDLKNREIGDLLNQQETASYAAMLEGQDQERLRIARELHDRLGSTLAAVKLGIQGNPTTTYKQNLELVDNAIAEIRAVSHDLSGGNIERYGLLAALTELKHTLERSGNIAFDLYMEAMTLPSSLQVPLYRIVQELVSNTLKHANASSIILQISEQQDHLNIIYEDNGRGFDLKNTTLGMGLENIRHRLSKWDGILEIDTHPGRGTIVIISIPHKTHYHD